MHLGQLASSKFQSECELRRIKQTRLCSTAVRFTYLLNEEGEIRARTFNGITSMFCKPCNLTHSLQLKMYKLIMGLSIRRRK